MARKKKGLPFVVQPRRQPLVEQVGNEESGVLEIERRGYLTVEEKSLVQYALEDEHALVDMYAVAGRIAREVGVPLQQVLEEFTQQPLPSRLSPYEDEIARVLVQMMAYQEKATVVHATALLISRVDSDWTIDQTMNLHPDLIRDLAALFAEEEQRSTRAFEKQDKEEGATEGIEKKA